MKIICIFRLPHHSARPLLSLITPVSLLSLLSHLSLLSISTSRQFSSPFKNLATRMKHCNYFRSMPASYISPPFFFKIFTSHFLIWKGEKKENTLHLRIELAKIGYIILPILIGAFFKFLTLSTAQDFTISTFNPPTLKCQP